MRVGSLFSGCGGLDLGLELAGHEIVWLCENDPSCQKVLKARFPGRTVFGDVRDIASGQVTFGQPVDCLAGGFPCQDLSNAGSGAGLAGERSGLWYAFRDAIRRLEPRHVLVENVPGIYSKMGERPTESAFGTVIADLAEAGYVGQWEHLRAADVGSCHLRERVFILATYAGSPRRRQDAGGAPGDEGEAEGRRTHENHEPRSAGSSKLRAAGRAATADAAFGRLDPGQGLPRPEERPGPEHGGRGSAPHTVGVARPATVALGAEPGTAEGRGQDGSGQADARARRRDRSAPYPDTPGLQGPESEGRRLVPAGSGREDAADADGEPAEPRSWRGAQSGDHTRTGPAQRNRGGLVGEAEPWPDEAPADADGIGRGLGREPDGQPGLEGASGDDPDGLREVEWGEYAAAVERWGRILGRPAPSPVDARGSLDPRFVEWMMGFPDGWTEIAGIGRPARLRMLGNAVHVQCAELVGRWLDEV